jgi:peroxiredoxin
MGWEGTIGTLSLWLSLTTSAAMGPHPVATSSASAAMASARSIAGADQAPDFEVATAYGWHRFSELHRGSPVLLVFEPDEATLAALESAAPGLAARGVELAAVTQQEDAAHWKLIEKLGLRYRLFSDPSGHIAELFGLTNPALDHPVAAWCLIDRSGRILDMCPGLEPQAMVAEVESAVPVNADIAAGDAMR